MQSRRAINAGAGNNKMLRFNAFFDILVFSIAMILWHKNSCRRFLLPDQPFDYFASNIFINDKLSARPFQNDNGCIWRSRNPLFKSTGLQFKIEIIK